MSGDERAERDSARHKLAWQVALHNDEVEGILVLPSALKHPGITEADIGHVLGFSVRSFDNDDDGSVLTIGPDESGVLLEVGHRAKWRIQFVVFHAMEARDKFLTPKERSEVRRR